MLFGASHYREYLTLKFQERCAKNARYSLRAFARDLGLSVTSLSLIIHGKQGLSRTRAIQIAKQLGLNPKEQEYFRDLVESQHSRCRKQRELARIRLRKHDSAGTTLQLDAFQVMSDWYHFAILELTMIEGFQSSTTWIAKTLGVPVKAIEMAIERMKKLELIEEVDGKLRQSVGFLATPSDIPSDALKKFHQQVMKKAEEALFSQPVAEREFAAIMFPVKKSDIPWAKQQLKEFRRSFVDRLEQSEGKDALYCLSLQFFSLQQEQETMNQRSQK